ncbi:phage antirepressor KilAC domain-containing protein [Psychrobacter sanguinis]|uniref:phage antirepressor KilAC domain-containing protein n=1 Tax=Psychrobacter sanguinis TaxID=861445 RepID=UPI00289AFAB7|nr:phage antirepressor KilAC domain-containing protein [Psychrobacter sanguinis]
MNLPTIQEHKELVQAVSARDLYQFLQPTERFSNWFDRQLQYGFENGVDYLGCKVFNTLARQELQDFYISIDMAKEISMIQRSEKGKQARQYFIECERRATQPAFQIPQTLSEALRLAATQAETIEQQQERLALVEPKAAALDVIGSATGSLGVRETAKTIGIAQNKFVAWCVNNEWMYRDSKDKLQPYSGRIQQGYMEQRPVTFNGRDGTTRATTQPMFTPKGLARLAQIFAIVHEVA